FTCKCDWRVKFHKEVEAEEELASPFNFSTKKSSMLSYKTKEGDTINGVMDLDVFSGLKLDFFNFI
ncbi:hypothetical protein DVH24_032217, partial [Malus domestica]